MTTTDRYCAACSHHGTRVHDPDCPERVQLPSPEDWQAIEAWADRHGNYVPPTWDKPTNDLIDLVLAAVRNMREAQP